MDLEQAERFVLECDDPSEVIPVSVVKELLMKKDENLQVAAEFGSQLLAKSSALETENQSLSERIQARNQEMDDLYNLLAETKADLEIRSQSIVSNQDTARHVKGEEESFELKSLRQKYNLANDQLKEAATTNSQLMAEIEQKNQILQKLRGVEKEVKQYREENEKLHITVEKKETLLQKLTEENTELKKEQRKLKENIKEASALQYSLESEISNLKHLSQNKDNPALKKVQLLQEDLDKAEELITDQEKRISDLEWEKKNIEKAITETLFRNQELERERKEHLRFLDEARTSVANYRLREEEHLMEISEQLTGSQGEGNILSELEKELENRIGEEKQEVPKKEEILKSQKAPVGAPANCEEYFFLAVTAVKISCAMKAPVSSASAFRVNAEALYQQLLEAEVPFHDWYEWVKRQFERKLESFQEKEEKEKAETEATPQPEPETIRAKFARFMRRSNA